MRALDERPPFAEQDEAGVTYAHKIEAADRTLDPTRPPDEVERTVRALRPHIGARLPLPDGTYLGVVRAEVDGETLAPAGGRVRAEDDRLLLDCNGGALELIEIQPPGGRPMPAADWLRGRPAGADDFWLDPRLPERPLGARRAGRREWGSDAEWAPHLAALAGAATRRCSTRCASSSGARSGGARVAAYVLGQLGSRRARPRRRPARWSGTAGEENPDVLAAIAGAFGNLGAPHGTETLLRLHRHPDPRVRDAVADALAGRDDARSLDALIELSADPDPRIRDWATFALGTLSPPTLRRCAPHWPRASRTARQHPHRGGPRPGAPRRRARADATLDLLGEVGPHDDGGNAADTIWKRYALTQATVRLAALTGDARLKEHLPRSTSASWAPRSKATSGPPTTASATNSRHERHLDRAYRGRDDIRATNVGSRAHSDPEPTLVPPRRSGPDPSPAAVRGPRARRTRRYGLAGVFLDAS